MEENEYQKEDEFTKFLQRSPRIPVYHQQQEGLFSRRFSDNILADVSTNQRKLRNITEEEGGKDFKAQYEKYADNTNDQHILKMIQIYNKGHHSKFHLLTSNHDKDLDYEGALRFYFDDGKSELTKAVRITNRTTTEELIPKLVEKFSLPHDDEQYALYEVHEQEEDESKQSVLLYPDECPLARAISSKKVPRFVLRKKDENSNSVDLLESPVKKEKRKKLFSFSRNSEDKEKPDKEKKSKLPRNKKGKLDKSAITIEVNHLEEPNATSEGELNAAIGDSVDIIDGPLVDEKSLTDVNTSSSPISLDSDIVDGEETSQIYASIQEVNKEDPTADFDVDSEEDILTPLPSAGDSTLKRKLSFSNSSVFFEQDNDPPVLENRKDRKTKNKSEKKKKPKSTSSTSRTKSFSMMVRGNKKKDVHDPTALTELSTYKLAPGILKIFGDHVSKGSNYKAVRASTISTSQEVVKMALERYGLEARNPKDFVLCDVVGHFSSPDASSSNKKKGSKKEKQDYYTEKEEPKWVTEYVRAINDNEKPLVLQSLWKPTNGRSRRFELRKRHDVESSCFFINTADGMGKRSSSQTSLFDDSEDSSINENSEKAEYMPIQMSPHTNTKKITHRQDKESDNKAPQYSPYLLLLHGTTSDKDQLVHKLEDPTVVVGSYVENEIKQCNVVLYSNDVLLPHCWIYKKVKLEEDSSETNLDEINFLVFIEPASGAEIAVNGKPVTSTTLLKPGHLVSFGRHYLFLFKDPTQRDSASFDQVAWWGNLCSPDSGDAGSVISGDEAAYAKVTKAVGVQAQSIKTTNDSEDQSEDETDEDTEDVADDDFLDAQSNLASRKKVVKNNLQFSYQIKEEEELLHTIIDISEKDLGDFKLVPAYFLVMAIEHSASAFTEIQSRKLLLKICNGLQGIAWEKTKEIGKQSSVKEENPMNLLNKVLPELKPVLFWMANALEMLHFLQNRLSTYLLAKEEVATSKDALLTADEELLTVLEEVIMFTFQQTVYHLTKVLYIALPAIIDTNPFTDDDEENTSSSAEKDVHPSVDVIPQIFQQILDAATEHQVHPQIISQLFAYLFFFSNASLFNALMERGPGGKLFRWTKGVQMRANLDVLEEWAQDNKLSTQFDEYLAKFKSAVTLLATPKAQIIQMEWNEMRTDNQALSPAQLQQLLSEYQLGGKQRPRGWYPPPEEVEPALRTSEVLESFATHPPLMLPSTNFKMTLEAEPQDGYFQKCFENILKKFSAHVTSHRGGGAIKADTEAITTTSTTVTVKSKKARTQSNIDLSDLNKAIQQKHDNEEEEANTNGEEQIEDYKSSEPIATQQVGSIKSIQVQSKKSALRITTHSKAITTTTTTNNIETTQHQADDDVYEIPASYEGNSDDVFVASLTRRGDSGLGLGLIDGMFTPLQSNGIYVRTIVPNTPASEDTRLRVGDRILAVNGNTLVGAGYNEAMDVIKKAGSRLSFLIAKSDDDVMGQVLATAT